MRGRLPCKLRTGIMAAWRSDPEHVRIQTRGREEFFRWYRIRVSRVEREYAWEPSNR